MLIEGENEYQYSKFNSLLPNPHLTRIAQISIRWPQCCELVKMMLGLGGSKYFWGSSANVEECEC